MTSPNFYALLIGIDGYDPNPTWSSLRGAVRDIDLVADYLERSLQLAPSQIIKLLSPNAEVSDRPISPAQRPTYANIVQQMQRLTQQAQAGDRLYIHYSGHGAQIATAYPELRNKGQWDEGLVPCDIGSHGYYLRDVELAFLLNQMSQKGLEVTLVLDSCNSGGATRGENDYRVRGGTDPNPGAVSELVGDRVTLMAHWQTLMGSDADSAWLPPSPDYTLLAACRSNQFAHEFELSPLECHGALTYWMIDTLKSVHPAQFSLQALHDRLLAKLHSRFRDRQVPLLMGDGQRAVFGGDLAAVPYTATVLTVERGAVTLNAGMAQGLGRGSRFCLYPLNAQDFADPGQRLAIVEVTQVAAVTATAKVLRPEEGGMPQAAALESLIAVGSPALPLSAPVELARTVRLVAEKLVGPGEAELPAVLSAQQVNALALVRQALHTQGLGWVVELPDAGASADFQVAIARNHTYDICLGAAIPHLGPGLSIHEATSPQQLVQRLIYLSKYQAIAALDNPAAHRLTADLDFALLDQNCQPLANHPVIQTGDPVILQIVNRSDYDLNIAVLDLEPTWEISQIPLLGIETAFHTLLRGDRIEQPLIFSLPGDGSYLQAQETLKLFATRGPADYRWLTLPSLDQPIRTKGHASRSGNPFSQLLQAIGDDASQTRETRTRAARIPPSPDAEWTTKQISLTIVQT
jgi:hypothetical protein